MNKFFVLFIFCFCSFARATTREEIKDRIESIETPYLALKFCGYVGTWKDIIASIEKTEDIGKEDCLLTYKNNGDIKNTKYQTARAFIAAQDCTSLATPYLKAVCIILQGPR
jgi:hypothetical protein